MDCCGEKSLLWRMALVDLPASVHGAVFAVCVPISRGTSRPKKMVKVCQDLLNAFPIPL
jgi:hypothetical protein